jgi:hypothetical protein
MQRVAWVLLSIVICPVLTSTVWAQEPRVFVGVKGGATAENSEDGVTGTVPALGANASIAFTSKWRAEFEFWLPGYLEDDFGEPKHRDVLFSVAARRMFAAGRTRPFLVAGISFSRTQDWFSFCTAERAIDPGGPPVRTIVSCGDADVIERRRERNDGMDGYLLVGGGVEIPITSRLQFVADLRGSIAPTSFLLRPGAGLALKF